VAAVAGRGGSAGKNTFNSSHVVGAKVRFPTNDNNTSITRLYQHRSTHIRPNKTSFFSKNINIAISLIMNQMSRMNDSDTTTHSSTSTGSLYPAERPLRNVNIDPSYTEVIEEQDQKIKHLQQQLAEFNSIRYRTF